MSAKALLFVIAACVVSACAQMPGGPPPSPPPAKTFSCTGANCDVKVSVKCDDLTHLVCWIEVDYEWVKVPPDNKSPVITWEIVTAGYTFPDFGIIFPSGSPFQCHRAGSTKFMCNDMHSAPGTYKYTIIVTGLPLPFLKDPWVENQ